MTNKGKLRHSWETSPGKGSRKRLCSRPQKAPELTGQSSCQPSLGLATLLSSAQELGMWHHWYLVSLPCNIQHLTIFLPVCACHPAGPLISNCIRQALAYTIYVISEVFIFSTDFSSDLNFAFAFLLKYHGHHRLNTPQASLWPSSSQDLAFLYPSSCLNQKPRSHCCQNQIM